ncbi:MAG: asparagine synthase (glutamine-hydrolyzing) [Deltaproteobacteria bacterium]|nr:asparagine synthase (glutamine-hydrolyzing) [Deltaproteobacteria bacterium]
MCGITGIVALGPSGRVPDTAEVTAMVAALRHRGPDEFGMFRDHRAALGHARLSIVDLSNGQQPMCNEDGTLWVVFNGEIYNHVELRVELQALGHRFRTRCDTEVILHAFESWGEDAFRRFNGQFALALWHASDGTLVLARDPLGVRPVYLCEHAGRLYFASELKAIFAADPSIPREFDPAGLAETFTFWTVVPPQSVFRGVTELEPGHARTYARGTVRDTCFYQPRFPVEARGELRVPLADAVEQVRSALQEAVRLRMLRSDVPVGSYLSGGLDSSLIAALGRTYLGDRLRTFSLRFADAEYDETPYQRAMVKRMQSDHRELLVRREDIANIFPDVVEHAERPLLRTAPAPLFLLSRLVRDAGIKVVLTGEGADEMFAGYDLFREGKVRRFWGRQPGSSLRPRLLDRLYPYLARSPVSQQAMAREFFGRGRERWQDAGFAHQPRWQGAASLQRLFAGGLRHAAREADVVGRLLRSLPAEFPRWTSLAQDQYLEVRTLLSGYLLSSQGDRMLMAHSVEGRFPFLDPGVVALANALPPAHKLHVLDEKHVLKRVSDGLVPPEIIRRPKQPYRAPDALAFVGPGAPDWVGQVLSESAVFAAGVFDPRAVTHLWRKVLAHDAGEPFSNADNMALVGVLSTQLLHHSLVARTPAAGPPVHFKTRIDRVAVEDSR